MGRAGGLVRRTTYERGCEAALYDWSRDCPAGCEDCGALEEHGVVNWVLKCGGMILRDEVEVVAIFNA